jgi:hypothetical protein
VNAQDTTNTVHDKHHSRNEEEEEEVNWDNLEGIDDEYDDSHMYYITDSGKVKYKRLEIHAPKDEIYEKLSEAGLISAKFKKPLPVHKLVKRSDAEIVGWFYYCSVELLQFFRICHNLKEVKAIVEYHIRYPLSSFLFSSFSLYFGLIDQMNAKRSFN